MRYELFCQWSRGMYDDTRKVLALDTGDIPFVPEEGFEFVVHACCPPVTVRSATWHCHKDVLVIDAEHVSPEPYLDDLMAEMKAAGIKFQVEE